VNTTSYRWGTSWKIPLDLIPPTHSEKKRTGAEKRIKTPDYHDWGAPWWEAAAIIQHGGEPKNQLLKEIARHETSDCTEIWQICRAIRLISEGKDPGRFGRWLKKPNTLLLALYTKTGRKRKIATLKPEA